jgi:hypothetical protein
MSGDGQVLLGFIHGGTVRTEFMTSVFNACMSPQATPLITRMLDSTAGPLIAIARNQLVTRFLETECEWLWTIDTDIVFRPDTLPRLLGVADPLYCPVVSALYRVLRKGEQGPAAYEAGPDDKGCFIPLTEHLDGGRLRRVAGLGAGCMLIHRSVLEDIAAKHGPRWFTEMEWNEHPVGEDLSFCIRAQQCDIRLHVHTGIQVGHVKPVLLGEVT